LCAFAVLSVIAVH